MNSIRIRVLPALIPVDGREVEFQVSATHIQWRYVPDANGVYGWANLIALADLVGAPGAGVEMRSDGANIQYRSIGEADWTDIIPLADITGPQGLQGFQGERGDIGPRGVTPKGDYSGSTAYVEGDAVLHNGSTWVALGATTGNAPPTLPTTSNTYWQLLARRGADGDGTVNSIVAGDGIEVDNTDPTAPEVSVVAFTGDSGSGGTLGGVPAPAAGDAAANKFLKASGAWAKAGGGGGDNPILNPDHEVCQNPTSVTTAADGTELTDRWVYNKTGAAVHTISRDTDAPTIAQQVSAGVDSPRLLRYSFRATLTTPDDSIAAGDHVVLVQKLEGTRFRPFAQQARKGRCWFKTTITGTFSVSFRNGNSDVGACVQITMNAANTWELKEFDIPASPSSGTWVYDNSGCGLRIGIVLLAGSTYQVASYGTWYSGAGVHAVAGQTNFCGTGSTEFRFTGFEIFDEDQGPSAPRYLEEELELCRRVRRRFANLPTNTLILQGTALSATLAQFIVSDMRALSSCSFGGTPRVREEGVGNFNVSSIAIVSSTNIEGLTNVIVTCATGLTTGKTVNLAVSGTGDYIDLSGGF